MALRPFTFFLLLPGVTLAQTPPERKATVAYLRSFQTEEGGFRPVPEAKAATLRATSSGLRAIRYFGGSAGNLAGCKKFTLSCLDGKTGGFADTPGGKPDVVVTAVGLMALVELKVPTDKYEKAAIAYMADNAKQFEQVRMAAAGLEAIGRSSERNKDWLAELASPAELRRHLRQGQGAGAGHGSAVACELRLGGEVSNPGAVVKALDAGQRDDGGFGKADVEGSDLETSYRVMRTYHMLKAKPKRAGDLRAFVAKCRNADGGYGVTPGTASSLGGTYFAGIILHWLGER
ncbi:MAG: prenyltransferase/squalene oxidase repeat-containing protein [Gemmataceae bacterium]